MLPPPSKIMNVFCHSERSGAKRNAVEESLAVVCVALRQMSVRGASTPLGMTGARHHFSAA